MTTIDDEISDKVDIIKMDVEGAEKDALIGSKRHIVQERPKLIICAYHLSADIIDIPKLIDGMRDDYHYYIRFYGYGCIWPCDYVIFAV